MEISLKYFIYIIKEKPLSILGLFILIFYLILAIIGPIFLSYDPESPNISAIAEPPSLKHWMGTNALGMDIYTRIIYAIKIDLFIALLSVLFASIIGSIYGIFSAYMGNWIDELMMRILDSIQAFPTIILAISLSTALGPSSHNLILVLIIVNAPIYGRLVRSQALSVKKSQFIDAAVTVGNSKTIIILKHLLPNCISSVFVTGSINIGWSVLMAAALSFIGFGVQSPTPELGLMIYEGARYMILGEWWMSIFPGIFIFLFVLSSCLLGDGLQELLDPKLR